MHACVEVKHWLKCTALIIWFLAKLPSMALYRSFWCGYYMWVYVIRIWKQRICMIIRDFTCISVRQYWLSSIDFPCLRYVITCGFCCQKQVSQAGIRNYIPQKTVGCNYLSLPEIPASGNNVLICLVYVSHASSTRCVHFICYILRHVFMNIDNTCDYFSMY